MLLTVIIVTKNPGDDIFPTLSSLRSLDGPSVEILLKDNSDNTTLENINEVFCFKNFRYIHSDDQGIYDAMNQALRMASGKFIYFLNAGDIYLDCGLLKILKNDDKRFDFYYGNIINLLPFVRLIRYSRFINKYSVYLRRVCHQSIVFRKQVFDQLGEFDTKLKVNADYLLILRMIDQFQGKPLDCYLAVYKGGGSSYDYQPTSEETKYLNKKLKTIFRAPELWFLSIASVIVSFLVYLKNFNKPI